MGGGAHIRPDEVIFLFGCGQFTVVLRAIHRTRTSNLVPGPSPNRKTRELLRGSCLKCLACRKGGLRPSDLHATCGTCRQKPRSNWKVLKLRTIIVLSCASFARTAGAPSLTALANSGVPSLPRPTGFPSLGNDRDGVRKRRHPDRASGGEEERILPPPAPLCGR